MSSKTTAKNTVAPPSREERAYLDTQQKLAAQQLEVLGTQADFQADYMTSMAPLLDKQIALMDQELSRAADPQAQALQQQTLAFQSDQTKLAQEQLELTRSEMARANTPEALAQLAASEKLLTAQVGAATEQLNLAQREMQRLQSPEQQALLDATTQNQRGQAALTYQQLEQYGKLLNDPVQAEILRRGGLVQLRQVNDAANLQPRTGPTAPTTPNVPTLGLASAPNVPTLGAVSAPGVPQLSSPNAPAVPTIGMARAPGVPGIPKAQGANSGAGSLEGDLLARQKSTLANGYNATPQQLALINAQYRNALDMGGSDISTYSSESMQRLRDELAPSLGLRPTDTPIQDRGGVIQKEAVRQYGQLARSLAGQQAGASLQYPLETARMTDASSQAQQGLGLANRQFVQGADADAAKFGYTADLAGRQFEHAAGLAGAEFSYGAGLAGAQFTQGANLGNAQFQYGADLSGRQFETGENRANAQFGYGADLSNAQFTQGSNLANAQFGFGAGMDVSSFAYNAEMQRLMYELQAQGADRAYQTQVSGGVMDQNANRILGASGLTGQNYGADLNAQRQTMLGSTMGGSTNPISGAAGQQQAGTIGLANQSFQTGLAEQAALNRAQLLGTTGNYTELGMTGGIGLANASRANPLSFQRGGTSTTTASPGFAEIMGGVGGLASGLGSMGLTFSDERVKEGIKTHHYDDQGRRWVSFAYKDDPLKLRRIGVIAQEVRGSDPDAVIETKGGLLAVDYSKLKAA